MKRKQTFLKDKDNNLIDFKIKHNYQIVDNYWEKRRIEWHSTNQLLSEFDQTRLSVLQIVMYTNQRVMQFVYSALRQTRRKLLRCYLKYVQCWTNLQSVTSSTKIKRPTLNQVYRFT